MVSSGSYACRNNRVHGGCSNNLKVRRDLLERHLLYALRHDLFTAEQQGEYAERARRLVEERRRERRRNELRRQTRRREVEVEIANIISALKAGIVSPTVKAELELLETEKAELEARPEEPNVEAAIEALPSLVERYRRKLAGAEEYSASDIAPLRALVGAVTGGEIILQPSGLGVLSANVRGVWRGLWKTVMMYDEETWFAGASSVSGSNLVRLHGAVTSLVAGRGFEPLTFRL